MYEEMTPGEATEQRTQLGQADIRGRDLEALVSEKLSFFSEPNFIEAFPNVSFHIAVHQPKPGGDWLSFDFSRIATKEGKDSIIGSIEK